MSSSLRKDRRPPASKKLNSMGAKAKTKTVALHSDLPDPEEMMQRVTREIKELKVEAKALFERMESEQQELEQVLKEVQEVKQKSQEQKLKGNELMKVDHLTRMGFDEKVLIEHLKKENKKVEKLLLQKQKDKKNVEVNIAKMKEMNEKCEQALIAAKAKYDEMALQTENLQKQLDNAELALYSADTQASYKKNMRTVDFTSKDGFKQVLKDVVKEVKNRCVDDKIVKDVMKIAAKCLSRDFGVSTSHLGQSSSNFGQSSSNFGYSTSNLGFSTNLALSASALNFDEFDDDSSVSISSASSDES